MDINGLCAFAKEDNHLFEDLENILINLVGKQNIIFPGQIQRNYSNIQLAIQSEGWPSLEDSIGKFMFVLTVSVYDYLINIVLFVSLF